MPALGCEKKTQDIETSVQMAIREAGAAAMKVEQLMNEALRAAESMEEGSQRETTIEAVRRSASSLRMSYRQYERLDEHVAEAVAPMRRLSLGNRISLCVGACCSVLVGACRGTLRATFGLFQALKTPVLFFAVGCVVYQYLEGWSMLDVVYFSIVTSTTVGYGDLCPTTPLSKLFTCAYALVGITVILGSLAPLVAFLRGDWRDKLLSLLGCAAAVDTNDPRLTMEQINARISYKRRYALAMLGPMVVLTCGLLLHAFFIAQPSADGELTAPLRGLGGPLGAQWAQGPLL